MTTKAPIVRSTETQWRHALNDFINSFSHWRVFCLMGANEIRKRYSRSKLGQFWLTLSLAITIGVMGGVWSALFKIPLESYLPYIAAGIILWTYISSCIIEGASVFINNASYIKELSIPKLSYCNGLFIRNLIILLHNIPVFIVIYCIFGSGISFYNIALSLLGLTVTTAFLYATTVALGLIGLRFRDVPNIVTSLIQVTMYVTPILWRMDAISAHAQKMVLYNPLTFFMAICKNPLFNETVPYFYWQVVLVYTGLAWLIAAALFIKLRARIAYWL